MFLKNRHVKSKPTFNFKFKVQIIKDSLHKVATYRQIVCLILFGNDLNSFDELLTLTSSQICSSSWVIEAVSSGRIRPGISPHPGSDSAPSSPPWNHTKKNIICIRRNFLCRASTFLTVTWYVTWSYQAMMPAGSLTTRLAQSMATPTLSLRSSVAEKMGLLIKSTRLLQYGKKKNTFLTT